MTQLKPTLTQPYLTYIWIILRMSVVESVRRWNQAPTISTRDLGGLILSLNCSNQRAVIKKESSHLHAKLAHAVFSQFESLTSKPV